MRVLPQLDESGSGEVAVERECVMHTPAAHHGEARGIDEGELTVVALPQPGQGLQLELIGHMLDV